MFGTNLYDDDGIHFFFRVLMFQSAHVHFQWSKSVFRDPWSPGHEVNILLDGCVGQTPSCFDFSDFSAAQDIQPNAHTPACPALPRCSFDHTCSCASGPLEPARKTG